MFEETVVGGPRKIQCWWEQSGQLLTGGGAGFGFAGCGENLAESGEAERECQAWGEVGAREWSQEWEWQGQGRVSKQMSSAGGGASMGGS